MKKSYVKSSVLAIGIGVMLLICMLVAMGVGRYNISIGQIINALLPEGMAMGEVDENVKTICPYLCPCCGHCNFEG